MLQKCLTGDRFIEHDDASLSISLDPDNPAWITVDMLGSKKTIVSVVQQLSWLVGVLSSDGEGLEISFPLLMKLSRVRSIVEVEQRWALYGPKTLLIPASGYAGGIEAGSQSDEPEKTVQWHVEALDSVKSYTKAQEALLKHESKGHIPDKGTMATARHFVGYCQETEIHLGTKGCNFDDIQKTTLDEDRSMAGVKIKSITAGTSGMGIFGFEMNIEPVFATQVAAPITVDDYDEILDVTGAMPGIIWDNATKRGWLVPMQAILLHMVHIWIHQQAYQPRVPLAAVGMTFLDSVADILNKNRSENLRGQGREELQLKDLVKRFWQDIQGCVLARQASEAAAERGTIGPHPPRISGWELMDFVVRKQSRYVMKADHVGTEYGWQALAAESGIITLVCRDIGDSIRPLRTVALCDTWRTAPCHKNYLYASLAGLHQLAKDYNGFRTPHTRLTSRLIWVPQAADSMFEGSCYHTGEEKCERRPHGTETLKTTRVDMGGEPITLSLNGAVAFGVQKAKLTKGLPEINGNGLGQDNLPGPAKPSLQSSTAKA
ncbi:hypothetical protein Cob_v000383 [Colletotrichum orbiculare MAFF 240422]|uniref:Uncharacterized protein n=1 Tax=Colletotrichum orbiculare (strain 104-T / ATCC 96160 / CBS 514.97 / LARS 414 / MAFF 240422) TaxID=1213857 RepID=A0A484G9W4_COLOR|nr:hypothetical protein Cob_v000383 [Colletotrichum orbiculare MAFF 240422]